MISKIDTQRIRNDAYIAVDALTSLIQAPMLDERYVNEKLNVVRSCVKFISNFEGEENDRKNTKTR